MTDLPETLIEAVRYFANADVCHAYMRRIKWPDAKPACPKCGSENVGEVTTRRLLKCRDCRKQFSVKVGTIFEDSPLPLGHWFVAVWSIANCKNGISSHELGRALGVTQKTAWFMLHRVRKAMEVGGFDKFDGPAEADTTYVGGRADNMHAKRRARVITGRGAVNKTAVHGVLQRNRPERCSQVSASVLGGETADKLLSEVRRAVKSGELVCTDEGAAYGTLCLTHVHKAVDHSVRYVAENVHVNGIENFWSLLKRGLKGTYVAVAPYHLCRYVAEQVFRFNERHRDDVGRFAEVMARVVGRRLTYRRLCGIEDAGFMGLV